MWVTASAFACSGPNPSSGLSKNRPPCACAAERTVSGLWSFIGELAISSNPPNGSTLTNSKPPGGKRSVSKRARAVPQSWFCRGGGDHFKRDLHSQRAKKVHQDRALDPPMVNGLRDEFKTDAAYPRSRP